MTTNHVSVRLDVETMARVDALAPVFSAEWHLATRSDILRGLILDALDRFEKAAPGYAHADAHANAHAARRSEPRGETRSKPAKRAPRKRR
jgi:hypothetical protein